MNNIQLSVDALSPTPIYKQLYDQISSQIMTGALTGGFCLPPIRTVAKELRISVITVKRAWEELEKDGYITTRVGSGCYVNRFYPRQIEDKKLTVAREQMRRDLAFYKPLGITLDELIALIRELYGNI